MQKILEVTGAALAKAYVWIDILSIHRWDDSQQISEIQEAVWCAVKSGDPKCADDLVNKECARLDGKATDDDVVVVRRKFYAEGIEDALAGQENIIQLLREFKKSVDNIIEETRDSGGKINVDSFLEAASAHADEVLPESVILTFKPRTFNPQSSPA